MKVLLMKKQLLLGVLTICHTSLLQAADGDYSTHAFSTDVQVEIVNKLMEEESCDGKGKEKAQKQIFVHIRRDGKELVDPFDVDLLNESKTLKNVMEDTNSPAEESIRNFLNDCSNDKQIALLIDALKSNENEEAASFVESLLQSEVEWLMNQSTCWNIPSVQTACIKQLACNLVHLSLNTLPNDYGLMISDVLDMQLVCKAIIKRFAPEGLCDEITTDESIVSLGYNSGETKLLIGTDRRVVIVDVATGSASCILTARADECIMSVGYDNSDEGLLVVETGWIRTRAMTSFVFTADGSARIESVGFDSDNPGRFVSPRRCIAIDDTLNGALDGLHITHQQLLFRALESWEQDKPYSIGCYDELQIYRSLLKKLQKPELFDLEKVRLKERLSINNILVDIKLPSMVSLLGFNWGSGSQE